MRAASILSSLLAFLNPRHIAEQIAEQFVKVETERGKCSVIAQARAKAPDFVAKQVNSIAERMAPSLPSGGGELLEMVISEQLLTFTDHLLTDIEEHFLKEADKINPSDN